MMAPAAGHACLDGSRYIHSVWTTQKTPFSTSDRCVCIRCRRKVLTQPLQRNESCNYVTKYKHTTAEETCSRPIISTVKYCKQGPQNFDFLINCDLYKFNLQHSTESDLILTNQGC
jgi:hypothetical protein